MSTHTSPALGPQAGLVPATLDLADHGRLALNGLLGSLDPQADHECAFLNILDVHPAYMLHWSSMVSGVMPKYMEALPLLRLMSGSRQDRELEEGFVQAMLGNAEEDGLIYDRASEKRPWNVGVFYGRPDWNEDYANMAGNGRYLTGLLYWHQWTGDPIWLHRARRTAERMLELAVGEGEQAWYPNPGLGNDFSYPRTSGWTTTRPPEKATEGFEGASLFYLFQPLRGWSRYWAAAGDERFLDLSRRFVNTGLQEKFWSGAGDMDPAASAERGRFRIHFHASMAAVRGVLDWALAAGDHRAAQFALDAYLYARQMGLRQLGLFPTHHEGTEGCSIADMVGMAVTLTDAGLGDFWDDVEAYARNGLVEVQATDPAELERVCAAGRQRPPGTPFGGHFDGRFSQANNRGVLPGQEIHERVLERTLGAFGHLVGARYQTPMTMHCCTANCCQGLYYAWEGILRPEDDGVAVNQWLNRRSPWADVWSWLPHAGRLVVQNKGKRRISVRQPSWARRAAVRCWLDGAEVTPLWRGNRLVMDGLCGAEQITVEAPCPLERVRCTLVNVGDPAHSQERYALELKGHTAVGVEQVSPAARTGGASWYGEGERDWYRVFRRDALRRESTPLRPASTYVHPEKLVHWGIA
ncbi:MAG: hypothetical protein AB1505_20405 [Candidatus Latescibacterota bacterium]